MVEAIERAAQAEELRRRFGEEAAAAERETLKSGKAYDASKVFSYLEARSRGKRFQPASCGVMVQVRLRARRLRTWSESSNTSRRLIRAELVGIGRLVRWSLAVRRLWISARPSSRQREGQARSPETWPTSLEPAARGYPYKRRQSQLRLSVANRFRVRSMTRVGSTPELSRCR